MKIILKQLLATAAVIVGISAACLAVEKAAAENEDAVWKAVHENDYRNDDDAARDNARHPVELMRFLGITKTMSVAEVNPGGGWYSRILGPLLKDDGLYVGLEHHPDVYMLYANYAKVLRAYPEKIEVARDLYGGRAIGTWIPATDGLPVEAGSLDVVLTVRALHNWYRIGFFDKALDQSWQILKDGGVFGIVQHRADESSSDNRMAAAQRGRWKQSDLIAEIEAKGFKLVASSEMNANPRDTKDYDTGVWTLPPVFALGEDDQAKYAAIGESDRMTLKFIKVPR